MSVRRTGNARCEATCCPPWAKLEDGSTVDIRHQCELDSGHADRHRFTCSSGGGQVDWGPEPEAAPAPVPVGTVTEFTRDMLAKAIESALAPMIGEPITSDNVETIKVTVARKLHEFWRANDVDFPMRIGVTAGKVRELLGKPTHVPEEATLWLLAQRVGAETDIATRAVKLYMQYDGEWRRGADRWQATEQETALGIAVES